MVNDKLETAGPEVEGDASIEHLAYVFHKLEAAKKKLEGIVNTSPRAPQGPDFQAFLDSCRTLEMNCKEGQNRSAALLAMLFHGIEFVIEAAVQDASAAVR